MKGRSNALLTLTALCFLFTVAFARPDLEAATGAEFLLKEALMEVFKHNIKMVMAHDELKGMTTLEGRTLVDHACSSRRNEIEARYKKEMEKVHKWLNTKHKGKDPRKPDARMKRDIEYFQRKLKGIEARRQRELQKLGKWRAAIIKGYGKYWQENDKKPRKRMKKL